MKGLNDPEFLDRLERLKLQDIDSFMDLVLEAMRTFPDLAVEDDVSIEKKRAALSMMRQHFEKREGYESCAFIRDLQKKIEDAEEGHVPRDEQ